MRKTGAEAPLRRRHHRKSIGAERDLHSHADLSLTKRHTLREAVLLYNLHSLTDAFAPRFSPTRFIPPVDPTQIIPRLDCFQGLGIKRYTLGVENVHHLSKGG